MILRNNGHCAKAIQFIKAKKRNCIQMTIFSGNIFKSGKIVIKLMGGMLLMVVFCFATCKYSLKDTSPIPEEIKTFRVSYLENRARYINPQLSPQITERLKQKIIGNTRLQQINDDNAHYDLSGYVSDYTVTTTGISGETPSNNRLSVSFHLIFKNTLDEKKNFETDLSNTFDFSANKTLSEAESQLNADIVKNIVDAIFNKIFSNW